MKRYLNKITSLLLMLLLSIAFSGCAFLELEGSAPNPETGISVELPDPQSPAKEVETGAKIKEEGYYTSKVDVALYLHTYGKLPYNFITKNEAINKGWEASKGNLWVVTEKMSIGGEKRIIYSNDGLIYYTDDHYATFKKLY